ncbi:MAG: biopolymer transporter Tol [Planctomycetia bacterium]|nr:biopolymer transporter Tol [Planctomycetia bacterium]
MNALLLPLALSLAAQPDDWKTSEAAHLKNIKQVTFDYVRAGEGYFSPDGTKIIFQAEEKGTGNPFYQIFVMDLKTGKATRISPGTGRTTCGYFRPDGKKVIFASSHGDPDAKKHQAAEIKQREEDKKKGIRRRYSWDFDPHMKIYEANLDGSELKCLTPNAKVYTAEGSYSTDGKKIVYSAGTAGNVQLFTMNADGTNAKRLTDAPNCYNGGPFFSPDGTKVIFRADRKEKDRLQLYVINSDGTGEKALTAEDKWVFWAPFWYKDNKHIIYTAADHSKPLMAPNYDLYWMNIESGKKTRITFAPGQDVLPVFGPNYDKVMWTSSRTAGPAQLFIADFTPPKE